MIFKDILGQHLELGNEVIIRRPNKTIKGTIKSFISDTDVVEVSSWAPSEKRFSTFVAEAEDLLKLDDIKITMPELFI